MKQRQIKADCFCLSRWICHIPIVEESWNPFMGLLEQAKRDRLKTSIFAIAYVTQRWRRFYFCAHPVSRRLIFLGVWTLPKIKGGNFDCCLCWIWVFSCFDLNKRFWGLIFRVCWTVLYFFSSIYYSGGCLCTTRNHIGKVTGAC